MEFSEDPEKTILNAMAYLKRQGWCSPGNWLVVITNALASDKVIDTPCSCVRWSEGARFSAAKAMLDRAPEFPLVKSPGPP
ncbi:MAG: hypothetical protein R3F31_00255 [Verrucomicrobiales bacterium]